MDKLSALWNLFRVGEAVDNPAAWKAGAITVTALTPVVLGLIRVLRAFGLEVSLDDQSATTLAGGVLVGVNLIVHLISSKTVGLLPKREVSTQDDSGGASVG